MPDAGDVGVDTPEPDACGTADPCPPLCGREVGFIGSDIGTGLRVVGADQTLSCDRRYRFSDPIVVEPGATLFIEPGVILEAGSNAYILIQDGARLVAEGTQELPIVFTSTQAPEDRAPGDWPGIVLFGDAVVSDQPEDEEIEVLRWIEPSRSAFGGDDVEHDCGSLRYVRIENAGRSSRLGVDLAFAGLTLGGCGTGTTIDRVQIHSALGDGAYFIGGALAVRRLMITDQRSSEDAANVGNGFIWNLGWAGSVQHLLVELAGDNGHNSVEGRMFNPLPPESPIVANATLVNPHTDGGAAIRLTAGSGVRVLNTIFRGHSAAYSVQEATENLGGFFDPDYFTLEGSILEDGVDLGSTEVANRVEPPMRGNRYADPELDERFRPRADGPANEGAVDLTAFGLEPTTYVGAIDPAGDDWTEGWTR